jgi:VanZ family protein
MKTMLVRGIRVGLVAGLMMTIALIFYFAVINNSPLPYHPMIDGWNDVILHIGAFGLLTIITFLIWPPSWTLVVILFCVGCAMELFQVFVPSREVDLMDLAANSVGIFFGGLAFLSIRFLRNRLGGEHRSFRE